ncbi:3-phosphoshikimate 1-carboxyvinyltransferase [Umezawaea tangerina]|uniref:3-phosphoshikimate 1-carboxyvinyltransferase n=1 Tax=Umezawaea tangerina TaxID=84725 RepID=A0A2T0STQ6_9PSEU|nr:hypothetical protein [Umezawaea tangerina]PRY36792.1 3-phosphoshikimate 1-carboxyvinyltransferase [Umezawaea tangerina]
MSVNSRFGRPVTDSADLVVHGRDAMPGAAAREVVVPGDKSVSHRALLAALLPTAPPVVTIAGANLGGAVRALLPAMRALGWSVEGDRTALVVRRADRPVAQTPRPHPTGGRWPDGVPYVQTEGSSAAARLLIGVLAGTGVDAVVDGDDVLRHRPMDWVVEPLVALGAVIDHLGEPGRLPVRVRGKVWRSGSVELLVGSAQARSAVLLAAVAARLPVVIKHPVRSRDHTERMVAAFGARLTESAHELRYDGGGDEVPGFFDVPADPSLAAYPVAARLLWSCEGETTVPGVCLNPTRLGFFEVLREAGADIRYTDERTGATGERVGSIVVRGGLNGVESVRVVDAAVLHSLIDEVPLLAAVAARLPGRSWIGCAEELRFKETDRLDTTARMVTAFGGRVEPAADGLTVVGGLPLRAGTVPGFEDHRVAMAAATLAMAVPGTTRVTGGACHRTSFPGFVEVQRHVGASVTEEARC